MFASLTADGFGPLTGAKVQIPAPMGTNVIRAPSEHGKTTLALRLVSVLLWGCEPSGAAFDARTLPGSYAEITGTTTKGTRFRRTFTQREPKEGEDERTFKIVCTIERPNEEPIEPGTEAAWQAALPPAFRVLPSARKESPILDAFTPMRWKRRHPRELLALLAEVSGVSGELRAEVRRLMGDYALRDTDPLLEGRLPGQDLGAKALRAQAKIDRDRAEERLAATRDALASLPGPPEGPSDDDLESARDILERAAAHAQARAARVRWEALAEQRRASVQRRDEWAAGRADLEARKPAAPIAAAVRGKVSRLAALEGELAAAREAEARATREAAVEQALAEERAKPAPGVAPPSEAAAYLAREGVKAAAALPYLGGVPTPEPVSSSGPQLGMFTQAPRCDRCGQVLPGGRQ